VVLAGLCAAFGYLGYVYLTLPDVSSLQATNPTTTAFIELRAREARAKGHPARREQRWVSYARISPTLKRAVLVAEDAGFWRHEGIDVDEIRKSLERDLEQGRFSRGGSTITQQLAKNLYLTPSKNPLRKLKELLIARRLEAQVSKRRILEIYLNVIEWGDGIYGAEAAAREHFGKPASSLTAGEAALLAAAIINPRVHDPSRPTSRLLRRQRLILARMGAVTPPPDPAAVPAAARPTDAPR
jgi:monofunctional biosynthetic peptidoglycan transglycosylase